MAQSLSIFQTLNHCRLLSRRSEGRITYQSIDCKLRSDCLNKLFHRDFQTVRIARGKSQSAAICMFCAKRWCQQKCFTRISSTVAKTNQKQRSFLKKNSAIGHDVGILAKTATSLDQHPSPKILPLPTPSGPQHGNGVDCHSSTELFSTAMLRLPALEAS